MQIKCLLCLTRFNTRQGSLHMSGLILNLHVSVSIVPIEGYCRLSSGSQSEVTQDKNGHGESVKKRPTWPVLNGTFFFYWRKSGKPIFQASVTTTKALLLLGRTKQTKDNKSTRPPLPSPPSFYTGKSTPSQDDVHNRHTHQAPERSSGQSTPA